MAKNLGRVAAGVAIAGAALLLKWFSSRDSSKVPGAATQAAEGDIDEDPGLATLGEVEEAIRRVEKFDVVFTLSGRAAGSNKRGFTPYPYQNKLNDDYDVKAYLGQRIIGYYAHHGLGIEVRRADGAVAAGGTKLRTVRETYKS